MVIQLGRVTEKSLNLCVPDVMQWDGSVSEPGCRFDPRPGTVGQRIWHFCSCGVGYSFGLDLILKMEIPCATG